MKINCSKHGEVEGVPNGPLVITFMCRKCIDEFREQFQAIIARPATHVAPITDEPPP